MKKLFVSFALLSLLLHAPFLSGAQPVHRVDAVGITVLDMNRALDFFTRTLPFEKIADVEVQGTAYENLKGVFGIRYRKVRLRLGADEIELTDYLTAGGRQIPEDAKSNDLSFQHIAIVVSNIDSAYARLRKLNVQHVSTAPQTLPASIPAAAGIRAFYFRDPAGHNLELIYFPPGKGDPKWQQATDRIFLGIDHTAIGIGATERSRNFYGKLLGVEYKGESFNAGTEQEHLNNVAGARLHITSNRAKEGVGVEFLEYLYPKNGKPYPADERADDLVHWETIMVAQDVDTLFHKLKSENVVMLSKEVVQIPDRDYGYRKGFYFRDPDGHVIGVFEK